MENTSTIKRKPITDFTEEEIALLPETFLCKTRYPGSSILHYIFQEVSKTRFVNNPNECFFIDSYWGYAWGNEIYIATYEDIGEQKKKKINYAEEEFLRLCKSLVKNINDWQ